MKAVIILLACLALVFAFKVTPIDNSNALNYEFINHINNAQTSWKATPHKLFEDMTRHQVSKLMGTYLKPNSQRTDVEFIHHDVDVNAIPTSFDSRTAWPGCIGAIQNQARCGSCWAFGCVESLSDRFCIHSNGSINVTLSFMDLVTCDMNDDGCEGGDPYTAWQYSKSAGLVEGWCSPYTIPTCPPAQQPCLNFVTTPACKKACINGSVWANDLHHAKTVYAVSSEVSQIQTEIMTNGPVEAAFEVYEDFVHYKSGVYVHTTGALLGGHAVKIIGWGVLNGTDYWTVANSWTTSWGADGFFLIKRGVDEVGIEDGIVAGLPNVAGRM